MLLQKTFLFSTLAFVASTLTIEKRINAQAVNEDVLNIDRGVQALTTHVEGFNDGKLKTVLFNGGIILLDVGDIHIANRKGFADANLASKFTEAESKTIVDTVTNTVAISIPHAVGEIKARKSQFQQAKLVPAVIASMKLLLYDHDTFSAAVLQKATLDQEYQVKADQGVAVIHDAIAEGIAFFKA